jgi:anti-sigma regulatory factor (Ser/Thr protein kinase)
VRAHWATDVGSRTGPLRHEAFLYAGDAEYLAGAMAFVHQGLASDEVVVVAVTPDRSDLLRGALGPTAGLVHWADVTTVGRNPARLIAAWHQFIDDNVRPGQRLRGIGQPVWPGRTAAELVECHRHEALANLSFANSPAWLLCPYDTAALDAAVIDDVYRSHPEIVRSGLRWANDGYMGADAIRAMVATGADGPLPEPDPAVTVAEMAIEPSGLDEVRRFVARHAAAAGLSALKVDELVVAVSELATNSITHGGGRGALRTWADGGSVVAEVRDGGHVRDPLAGRRPPAPDQRCGRGLWMVNELCDLVQLRSSRAGTTVRVHLHLR